MIPTTIIIATATATTAAIRNLEMATRTKTRITTIDKNSSSNNNNKIKMMTIANGAISPNTTLNIPISTKCTMVVVVVAGEAIQTFRVVDTIIIQILTMAHIITTDLLPHIILIMVAADSIITLTIDLTTSMIETDDEV
jgi:hypothetical protein